MKLYNISCKSIPDLSSDYLKMLDARYKKLYNKSFDANFMYKEEPSKEQCIKLISFLRQNTKFDFNTLTITYVREALASEIF